VGCACICGPVRHSLAIQVLAPVIEQPVVMAGLSQHAAGAEDLVTQFLEPHPLPARHDLVHRGDHTGQDSLAEVLVRLTSPVPSAFIT